MRYFWVSERGDKYHGWDGCPALRAEQTAAGSGEGHERLGVTRYDGEDAARAAALEHARCEAHACFARGRGTGLALLVVPDHRHPADEGRPARPAPPAGH
ncbi:hypothetical protein [Streptomyces sp. NPDC093970]|uniref:hypothetical protein n=1 Tax=Streptomyces sp. NPDC093970 TaxID=3155076 RepID=UPI00342882FD